MWKIISDYIGVLILSIAEIKFARIVLNKRINKKNNKIVIILLLTTLIFTLISSILTGTIKTLLLYFFHTVELVFLFDISYKKAMILTTLLFVVIIIPDMLSLFFVTKIVGLNKIICYNEFAGSILSNSIVGLLLILITILFKKFFQKIMYKKMSHSIKLPILCLFCLMCITIFFYNFTKEFRNNGNILPYLIVIITSIIVLFNLIKQTINNIRLNDEYGILLKYMTTYELEIENERITRHETKNELRTIRAMICEKQRSKDIVEYIDEIVNDKYEIKNEKYAKFGYLPPNGIKGLCYFKTQEAENSGVKVSINISAKIKKSVIYNLNIKQQRDLGRILGVILDNAIEASVESQEKQLGIEAYETEEKGLKIIISNTYNNKIDITKIGKERFSTKEKNRGHGLLLVKQLIINNNIFEIEQENTNNIYISTIIIKNN